MDLLRLEESISKQLPARSSLTMTCLKCEISPRFRIHEFILNHKSCRNSTYIPDGSRITPHWGQFPTTYTNKAQLLPTRTMMARTTPHQNHYQPAKPFIGINTCPAGNCPGWELSGYVTRQTPNITSEIWKMLLSFFALTTLIFPIFHVLIVTKSDALLTNGSTFSVMHTAIANNAKWQCQLYMLGALYQSSCVHYCSRNEEILNQPMF